MSSSPISLTSRGEQVSNAINAEAKVANHWDEIKKKMDAKNPTNPYDIQSVAMDIARTCFEQLFTPAEQGEIKTYAFKIGISLLEIYPIIGVIIRNKILTERGINIDDVDKYNPGSV